MLFYVTEVLMRCFQFIEFPSEWGGAGALISSKGFKVFPIY